MEGQHHQPRMGTMSDPSAPVPESARARRRGGGAMALAAVVVVACAISFFLVALGFGHRG